MSRTFSWKSGKGKDPKDMILFTVFHHLLTRFGIHSNDPIIKPNNITSAYRDGPERKARVLFQGLHSFICFQIAFSF